MSVCLSVCLPVCIYVCMYEFPYHNKQEIFEPKLFNFFVSVPFRLVTITSNNIFEKQLQRNPFLN